MKLVNVEVENYRSFNGVHNINLDNDFTLILGTARSGKTNIFNAIRWCLTSQEQFYRKYSSETPIVNLDARMHEKPITARVALKISENEKQYLIERISNYSSNSLSEPRTSLNIYKYYENKKVKIDNPGKLLGKICPSFLTYIIFVDGETIEEFGSEKQVLKIFNVLEIDEDKIDRFNDINNRRFNYFLKNKYGTFKIKLDYHKNQASYELYHREKLVSDDIGFLATSEQMLLGYSHLLSLLEILESEYPLIVDTPFGRMDKYWAKNLINELQKHSHRNQIILFTDTSRESYFSGKNILKSYLK